MIADSAQYWAEWRGRPRARRSPVGNSIGLTLPSESMRLAVRERIALVRRWVAMRPDPATIEANQRRIERKAKRVAIQLVALEGGVSPISR